jgi:hypothetical protein
MLFVPLIDVARCACCPQIQGVEDRYLVQSSPLGNAVTGKCRHRYAFVCIPEMHAAGIAVMSALHLCPSP